MLRSSTYSAIWERNSFCLFQECIEAFFNFGRVRCSMFSAMANWLYCCSFVNHLMSNATIYKSFDAWWTTILCCERVRCVESDDIKLNPVYLVRLVVVDRPSLRVHNSCCYCCCCCRSIWYHHDCSYRYYYWNSITLVPTHRHTLTRTLDWWIDPNFIIKQTIYEKKLIQSILNEIRNVWNVQCSLTRRKVVKSNSFWFSSFLFWFCALTFESSWTKAGASSNSPKYIGFVISTQSLSRAWENGWHIRRFLFVRENV